MDWLRFSNPQRRSNPLGEDLDARISSLLADWSPSAAEATGAWLGDHFRVRSPRTPRGGKALKEQAEKLRWWLTHGPSQYASQPDVPRREVERLWSEVRPQLAALVAGFTDEGGTTVPKALVVGENTYVNEVGANEATLRRYVDRLEAIFGALTGWHRKALSGGVTVVLASPRNFRGTAGGVYKRSEGGKLYVRATPDVLRRSGGYGSFEYILTHEVGHRYEDRHRLPADFDRPEWWTTRYSRSEGEAFAELFALSHFGLRPVGAQPPWDQAVVERFQALMAGQTATARPEPPEHLRRFSW